MIFREVSATAARTELAATVRFSARIAFEPKMAGAPDMSALSLWREIPPSRNRPVNLLGSVLRFLFDLSSLEESFESVSKWLCLPAVRRSRDAPGWFPGPLPQGAS